MYKSKSRLEADIFDIIEKGETYVQPEIDVVLHTVDEDYPIPDVIDLSIVRDYNNSLFDQINIVFILPSGIHRDLVLADKDHLEITISLNYSAGYYDRELYKPSEKLTMMYENGHTITNTYKLILTQFDSKYNDPNTSKINGEDLDKLEMTVTKAQCVPILPMMLKPFYVTGIHWDKNVKDIIKSYFGKYLNELKYLGKSLKYRLMMYEPDNTHVYDHIIFKKGLKLIKLPKYLQNGDYGIYNGDVNTYIYELGDKDHMHLIFIYPKYNYSTYKESIFNKLVILSSSTNTKGINEIAYYVPDNTTEYRILPTETNISNKGLHNLSVTYDTIHDSDPYRILDRTMKMVTDDSVLVANDLYSSMKKWDVNTSGFSNALHTNHDNNLFKFRSTLNKNVADLATFKIDKADLRIFKPGMPVEYTYTSGDSIITRKGILQYVAMDFNFKYKTNSCSIVVSLSPIKEGE